jgi:ArsR family transcriptional regulator, arsenate/arsenite/antimonite-responsive transcriptional repressor
MCISGIIELWCVTTQPAVTECTWAAAPRRRLGRTMGRQNLDAQITRFADMFSAMGTEPRLRIMRLLLSAHPNGMIVGDIGSELGIPPSTLSHHLDKLKNEELVRVRREGTFLWYSANADALRDLLAFLYAECCTRSKAIQPEKIVRRA